MRRRLALWLLGLNYYEKEAVRQISEGTGVVFACQIDPNPLGEGFRIRSKDPRNLLVSSCAFDSIPGMFARDEAGGALLLFTDAEEYRQAVEEETDGTV